MPRTKVDYATDQITVYRYCPYKCRYCYVWNNKLFASRVMRGKYDPVEEAKKYLNKTGRTIVVSFVSDPYPPEERDRRITRKVLEILCNTDNKILILTKNPQLALRDVDVMSKNCWLGSTVITLDKGKWRYWEPRTLYSPARRLYSLKIAHEVGVKTWLSIEPIIPGTTYPQDIINKTLGYIDYYVLGAFNYTKQLGYTTYTPETLRKYYTKHVLEAIQILEQHNKPYHIKKELKKMIKQ